MRAVGASVIALGALVGALLGSAPVAAGIPLITLPQGISARSFGDERVFVYREGTLTLTGFRARAPQSSRPVWWCPISGVFLEPTDATMWDARGRYVVGAEAQDLRRVPLQVDPRTQLVTAGEPEPAPDAGEGVVAGEVKLIYDNWLAGRLPLEVEFCRNALT